jgi:hypothetical protein
MMFGREMETPIISPTLNPTSNTISKVSRSIALASFLASIPSMHACHLFRRLFDPNITPPAGRDLTCSYQRPARFIPKMPTTPAPPVAHV